MATTVGAAIAATPASAHRFPGNCLTNGGDLTLDKSIQVVRPGDVIAYRLSVQNVKGMPCDITGSNLLFYPPTVTGAPSASGTISAANRTYVGGFPLQEINTHLFTVAVNPGVESVIAQAGINGVLHDVPGDTSFAEIRKTLGTQVTQPKITLDKIGSIESGLAPQNVTYTYLVRNESATPVPLNRVAVSDDICAGPAYSSGDNGDGLLSNGETWTYTCAMLHQAPGVYTNTASVCAYSTVPDDTTRPVCSPPDEWTVTLTPPPPPPPPPTPQTSVKPTTVAQAPCTLSTPSGLRVRAGQLNTIRVRVRNVDAGSTVTITLPGGRKVTAKTNANGTATLRVRPPKSGRATIRVAECSEVERLSVRPARRVTAQRNPRVTG